MGVIQGKYGCHRLECMRISTYACVSMYTYVYVYIYIYIHM